MRDNAARDLATAEAANAKARLLAPTRPEQEDPNIANAMAQAPGQALSALQSWGPASSAAGEANWRPVKQTAGS